MPQEFDITVSDLETLPGAGLDDGDRVLISRPGAFEKTVTWGDIKGELGIGADLSTLESQVAGKAPSIHQHAPTDIQGRGQPNGFATLDGAGVVPSEQIPPDIANPTIARVSGLQSVLDGKAPSAHLHSISSVTGLQSALNAKVESSALGASNGVATLGADGKLSLLQRPEVSIPVTSVAGKIGAVVLAAADIVSGVFSAARLGTGTPSATNFLRGDGAWSSIAQSEVTGLIAALAGKINTTDRGAANGVASLDASILIPSAQIPTLALTKLSSSGATTGQVVSFDGSAIVWASPAGGNLTWTVRTANATLATNENCVADTGVTELTLPASVSGSHQIINDTTAAIRVNRGGAATISGVTPSGAAITAQNAVLILPGQRGIFVANGGNWIAQGCEGILTFTYNGTPLSNNPSNPRSAGGILHLFGIEQGGGTWQNPTTGAATVTAAASAMGSGTPQQLSDRVASGQDVVTSNAAGSWFGWRFPRQVRITGFIFQTRGDTSGSLHLPRNWQNRAGNTTALVNGQDISSLAIVDTRSNQTAVNTMNTYYGPYIFNDPTWGNTMIWQLNGPSSGGANFFPAQEVEFFGDVEA